MQKVNSIKVQWVAGLLALCAAYSYAQSTPLGMLSTQAAPASGATPTLSEAVAQEKQRQQMQRQQEWSNQTAASVAGRPRPQIASLVPERVLGDGEPRVISVTGVGADMAAEILHYGRVYRVHSKMLPYRSTLWTAVAISGSGVVLKPASGWRADQLRSDRRGNVLVAAPYPGEPVPLVPAYATTPNAGRDAFPAAGVLTPAEVLTGGKSGSATAAQVLASQLPVLR